MIAVANVNKFTGRNCFDDIEQVGYLKRFAIVVAQQLLEPREGYPNVDLFVPRFHVDF